MKLRFLILMSALFSLNSCQSKQTDYPQEVGPAEFLRDFDTAAEKSKEVDKPILAFFQEVPG